MKKHITLLVIVLIQTVCSFSQNIASSRITNWESPGSLPSFNPPQTLILTNYGADPTGVAASDNALLTAITALGGSAGEIYIPKGTYLFLQPINLPDSVIIRGEVDTLVSGPLAIFKLSPGENHGISITGSESATSETLTYALTQGEQKITVINPLSFAVGDFIKLKAFDDNLLVTSSWAYNSTGQIFQITGINGNDLLLNKPLRRSYSGTQPPVIYKITPRKQVHIKCIKIERLNATTSQSANIFMNFTADCSVSGIASNYCNYTHVLIQNSIRITVENSFFQNGFSYGDGGKAYGTLLQFTASDCFIHQNIFKHLRHSMLLQAGANGNVLAYNYSIEPYWTDVALPANSAGDITLHGNYVYMNLFEGNVVQNIVIDDSHGINGPYNTFYRNRVELWGILNGMELLGLPVASPSNQQNFIGNQITNTNPLYGYYSIKGTDHFEYGNMVGGAIVPYNTYEPNNTTMFGYNFGSFYNIVSNVPPITTSNWRSSDPLIEALYRNNISEKKSICSEIIYDSSLILNPDEKFEIYPNPFAEWFILKNKSDRVYLTIKIYNVFGQLVYSKNISDKYNTIDLKNANMGMYFLQIEGVEKFVFKILKGN